jgi:hypothetical protein
MDATGKKEKKMKLSNQAMGAIMMALQKALLEQTDIVPVLQSFEFRKSQETKRWGLKDGQLIVANPPTFKMDGEVHNPPLVEVTSTTGSD